MAAANEGFPHERQQSPSSHHSLILPYKAQRVKHDGAGPVVELKMKKISTQLAIGPVQLEMYVSYPYLMHKNSHHRQAKVLVLVHTFPAADTASTPWESKRHDTVLKDQLAMFWVRENNAVKRLVPAGRRVA